jgi:hypothetical protein
MWSESHNKVQFYSIFLSTVLKISFKYFEGNKIIIVWISQMFFFFLKIFFYF